MARATKGILDAAIIGSGPAAFAAALYVARENRSVVVYEREAIGGLAGTISKIENYPGFAGTGADLMAKMRSQVEDFGAKVAYGECAGVKKVKDYFELAIDGELVLARSVLVATGSERRRLGVPGENSLGVSYCATCDAPMTAGKDVLVVGGGNSAVQETFHLLKYCKSVKMLVRSNLKCNDVLRTRVKNEPRIEVLTGVVPTEILREGEKLRVETEGGDLRSAAGRSAGVFEADFVFVFVGMQPATGFLRNGIEKEILAEDGSVRTKQNMETVVGGLFAAGDCRLSSAKQAIVAAGEGAVAAVGMGKYLEKLSCAVQ